MKPALKRGFTLIEILVVIVIIGVILAIIIASISVARAKSRDAQRRIDLQRLKSALDLYYTEHGHTYPSTAGIVTQNPDWISSESGDRWYANNGVYIPNLAPTYIASLPKDPSGQRTTYSSGLDCSPALSKRSYAYKSDGTGYKLLSHCAPEGTWNATDPFYDSARTNTSWMVCVGATECAW